MDNKQITIAAICGMLLLLTLVFACSKGCGSKELSKKKIQPLPQKSRNMNSETNSSHKYNEKKPLNDSIYSSGSSNSYSYFDEISDEEKSPPALISSDEKARMKKFDEEEEERLRKSAIDWLQNKLNDKTLSTKTREQYLLKANQAFNDGMLARKRKDYRSAIKYFNSILKDEKATPVTKYFALHNLLGCAQEMKDLELFFIAARLRAKLVATEDLSVIGIEEKNNDQIIWCNKVEAALKAKDNPAKFDEAVRLKIEEYDGQLERDQAERSVKRDIDFYSKMFKDFYE